MKKITIFLTICLLTFLTLVGCSNNTTGKQLKINFYMKTYRQWADNYVKNKVKEFNSTNNDNIYVNLKIFSDSDTYNTVLTSSIETGSCPEIYLIAYPSLVQEVLQENVVAIDEYLTDSEKDDYYEIVREFVTFKNKMYLFPWYMEPSTVFYYRKDILEANNLSVPTTIDELYDVCRSLEPTLNRGQYCLGLPVSQGDIAGFTWGIQYNYTGGLALTSDWMTSRLDNEGFKEMASLFYQTTKNGWTPISNVTSDGYANLVTSLCKENPTCVMAISGSWQISEIYESYGSYVDKIGIATMPTLEKNASRTSASNGGWGFGISSQASKEKQDAAAKFIKWLTIEDTERDAEYFKIEHLAKFPASKKALTYLKNNDSAEINPEWLNVIESISSTAIREATYSVDISYVVGTLMQNCIVNRDRDFDEVYESALNTAKNQCNSIITAKSWSKNPFDDEE